MIARDHKRVSVILVTVQRNGQTRAPFLRQLATPGANSTCLTSALNHVGEAGPIPGS
jgi:hypothetical protein